MAHILIYVRAIKLTRFKGTIWVRKAENANATYGRFVRAGFHFSAPEDGVVTARLQL